MVRPSLQSQAQHQLRRFVRGTPTVDKEAYKKELEIRLKCLQAMVEIILNNIKK
ncbi:MAG TPA: hypothetical protein VIQ00_06320 [Chitinophagaceae bacterium]